MDKAKRVLMLISIGIGISCFSEDIPTDTDTEKWRYESLECFSHGIEHLFFNEPLAALEYFEKGHILEAQSQIDSDVHNFCLYFAEAVVFDCLGCQEQCAQSIASMVQIFEAFDEEEDEEDYSLGFDEETDLEEVEKIRRVIEMMSSLASIAPSPEVRAALFSIIEQIADEELSTFQLADPVYLPNADWTFDYSNDDYSIELCKDHKKHKKKESREKKIIRWIEYGIKLYKKYQEIREIIKNWKNS